MWNSETNLDYLGVISGKRKSLLRKTRSKFTVPSKGVVFLFDKFNYVSYPKESDWRRNLGIHLDMKLDDVSDDLTPSVIKKPTISEAYSHLIWLSRRAWDGTEVDFVWTLSHELRHLEQSMKSRYLSLAGYFLYRNLGRIDIDEPKIQNTVPTELDSDIAAWRTTRQVISKSVADDYVHKNSESGKKQDDFSTLLKYDPEEPYFVCSETIRLMRKYKKELNKIINGAPKFRFYEIRNVDYITSKLSNIPETD